MGKSNRFSGAVILFQERRLPEEATLAGYSALIEAYELRVPLPNKLCAISHQHKVYETSLWKIYTPRHMPSPTVEDHLVFALKYEGIDLAVLKCLFQKIQPTEIETIVREKPTGSYSRRIWFLYEWLMDRQLDLPDVTSGTYVDAIDTEIQLGITGINSPRHRVKDNMPGTRLFCPLVFRTSKLDEFIGMDLASRAREAVSDVPSDILARTSAFLLLQDSRSSYAIEGEKAPQNRIQRWGRAIGQAGHQPLDLAELLRLQRIVIEDDRFIKLGLRQEGGFVGEHDRITRMPLPDHISARHEDLISLIDGLTIFANEYCDKLDAVVASGVLAFGFVYIHPFEDGNGRIQRYLIHHVLAQHKFNPAGVVFPVSSAILERILEYKSVLESYSKRLLPVIEWVQTEKHNVKVLNDTADFYRYFDATEQVEFLYECVKKTIEEDLPNETNFLYRYDRFKSEVEKLVDMPASMVDLLFNFLRQNDGKLSKRALIGEFSALTPQEIEKVEAVYFEIFVD